MGLLPENRDLLHMLRDGLIAAVMVIVYFVIPLLIIAVVFDWGWDRALADFVDWGGQWIHYWWVTLWGEHGVRPQDFWQLFEVELDRWLLHEVAPILYLVAAIPMFVTAMARFALTRRAASFFHFLSNAALSIRYLGSMAKFLFLVLLWSLAGVVVLSAVMATAIGVVILPVAYFLISAAEVWISARLAGNLAARIWESKSLAKYRPQAPGRAAAAAG